jgi:hypothetical protein
MKTYIKYMAVVPIVSVILFSGCCPECKIPDPVIINKIVEVKVPVKCNITSPNKPIYDNLNRSQKLYTEIEYTKKLEAALIACQADINNTK